MTVTTISLANDWLDVSVAPALGGSITRFRHVANDLDVVWRGAVTGDPTPTQPSTPYGGLYDQLAGSWFLSGPIGYFPSDYHGSPIGAHGSFRSLSFEVVDFDEPARRLSLVGASLHTPFTIERTYELVDGSPTLLWRDRIINRSGLELGCALLYHVLLGDPLARDAEIHLPATTVDTHAFERLVGSQITQGYTGSWPFVPDLDGVPRDCSRVPPVGSGEDHSVQATGLAEGRGCIWNDALGLGVAFEWDAARLPWVWTWGRGGGAHRRPVGEQYPIWGEGPMVSLQPSTSPLREYRELLDSDELLTVAPHGAVETEVRIGFVTAPDSTTMPGTPTGTEYRP